MIRQIQGVIHGKATELVEDLGVAECQRVEVQAKILPAGQAWGDGLRRHVPFSTECADEDDRILGEIYGELGRCLAANGPDFCELTRSANSAVRSYGPPLPLRTTSGTRASGNQRR